jgi:hypothetical protein
MSHWRDSFWVQGMALLGILLLAAFLRLWQIDTIPPGFHFDESFEGLEAWRILNDSSYRPIFLEGNFGVLPLNAYANAITFAVAGWMGGEAGPAAMRVTSALFGVLGVWAIFALGQEMRRRAPDLISPALPWLAAFSLAAMRWHLHFSRMGIEPILVPLAWALAAWLLLRAWRTASWWSYGALGATLAMSMYTYQGAWVIPFLIAINALHLLWADRSKANQRSRHWGGLTLAGVVAVVGILPLAFFFSQQPDLLLVRPAQLAIVGQTDSPADSTLGDALWATAKMFGPFGSPGDLDPRRNLPGAPALNLWQAIPFYLGMAFALWHSRRPVMALPVVGLVGLLLPGMISEYAPHFHRVLGAAGPVALFCGLGLALIWRWLSSLHMMTVRLGFLAPVIVALLLIAGTLTTVQNYFVRWANLPDLFYAFDEGLWDLGQWVAAQQSGNPLYISPQGDNHATLAFAWRAQPRDETQATPPQPIRYDGRFIFPLSAGENQHPERYAVIVHEDFRTPLLLPEVLPDAAIEYEVHDPAGAPYAQVYRRPVASTPARSPRIPLEVQVGDGISLVGYDLLPEPIQVGGSLYIQYHWQVTEPPTADWTVFSHLLDDGGNVVAGFDSQPGRGSLPTSRWQPGWRIFDEYELVLPADLPPGTYTVRMGLYGVDGSTLPATGMGVELGRVTLVE